MATAILMQKEVCPLHQAIAIKIVDRMLAKRKEMLGEGDDCATRGFNGGKMGHLFDIGDDNLYLNNINVSESSLDNTRDRGEFHNIYDVFIKVDGQNGAIVYDPESNECVLLTRYDDKKNKFKDGTNIPKGYYKLMKGNRLKYSKGRKTHHYYLEIWPRPMDNYKSKNAKILRELYSRVDQMESKSERLSPYEFNSCEFVGYKFQNTPGVLGNNIALHKEQMSYPNEFIRENLEMNKIYNTLETLFKIPGDKTIYDCFSDLFQRRFPSRELLTTAPALTIEGFILIEKNTAGAVYIKVRQNVFTKSALYEKLKKEWSKTLKSKDLEKLVDLAELIVCPNLISY